MTLKSDKLDKIVNPVLILLGTMMLFFPPGDPDYGWHIKYAEYFLYQGKLLMDNIFSYTLPDYHWYNSYWLSELLLYVSHNYFGDIIAGLLFSGIMSWICFKYLQNKTNVKSAVVFVFVILVAMLSDMRVAVRPMFFDLFFWLYLLDVLYYRRTTKIVKEHYLPLVFALWANMHAEFMIGLAVYSIWIFKELISVQKINKSAVIFLISLAATVINPYGIKLHMTLVQEVIQLHQPYSREWQSPISINLYATGLIIVLAVLALKFVKNRRTLWYGLLLMLFAVLSLKAGYFGRILVILAIPALLDFAESISKSTVWIDYMAMGTISILTLVYLVIFSENIYLASDITHWSKRYGYPYEAVQVLKNTPKDGNLYNSFRWGGYLIWQLPEYKTFIDGRMNVWTTDVPNKHYVIDDYQKIQGDPENNINLVNYYFKKYNIRYALNTPGAKLNDFLLQNGWVVVFKNDYSILLERKSIYAYRQ